jgi:hypothetical protein
VTAGNAWLNLTRWPTVRPGPLYNVLTSILLLAVGAFKLWFWASRVTHLSPAKGCQEYGFFFARIRLNSLGFRVLNLVLSFLVLLACFSLLLLFAAKEMACFSGIQIRQSGMAHITKASRPYIDATALETIRSGRYSDYSLLRIWSWPAWSSWLLSLRSNGTNSAVSIRCHQWARRYPSS